MKKDFRSYIFRGGIWLDVFVISWKVFKGDLLPYSVRESEDESFEDYL